MWLNCLFLTLITIAGQVDAGSLTSDFTDNRDGTVTQNSTGLIWMRCKYGESWTGSACSGTAIPFTWKEANAFTFSFGGKSDWRLPSIAEANSIFDSGNIFLNGYDFLWSATPAVLSNTSSWTYGGNVSTIMDISRTYPVRYVRGVPFDPKVAYTPTGDFRDNGDGTVVHLKTGLMWMRCPLGQTWTGGSCSGEARRLSWQQALTMAYSYAGYNDWYLPSRTELSSIVEYKNSFPALNTAIFPTSTTTNTNCWTNVGSNGTAYFVRFDSGDVDRGFTYNFSAPVRLVRKPTPVTPQSGWWWNINEPGRGYFIEVKNGRAYAASYLYDNSGYPIWYVTGPTSYSANGFSGNLSKYNGGQTLTGTYKAPTGPISEGNFSVSFSDATHATLTWPSGSIPLVRYEIASGSLSAVSPIFQPETGWWWNADEGGRGFSVEVQGDNMYIAGFMYDASGNPVWYATGGKMTTSQFYQGIWAQYGNGQALTGTWKEAKPTNPNVGVALFGFDSATTGLLQLPDGRLVKLTRFSF